MLNISHKYLTFYIYHIINRKKKCLSKKYILLQIDYIALAYSTARYHN